jgi:hypothetical protein
MAGPNKDLWPPAVGHRVVVREGGGTGTIRDIVLDAGEAKYRVRLDAAADEPARPFTLAQLDPYFPP